MLKVLLSKAEWEKLPDALKSQYVEQGGEFVLDVEEKDYKSKLGEFRDNNRKLSKEKEELVAIAEKYKGIDPEKYVEAMSALQNIEAMQQEAVDKELLKAGKLDEVITKRTETMKKEYEKQINSHRTAADDTSKKLKDITGKHHSLLISDATSKALSKLGINPRKGAITDIMRRAQTNWKVDEASGELKCTDVYDEKAQPVGDMDNYIKVLLQTAPFLFEEGKGGGASGGEKEGRAKTIDWKDPNAIGKNLDAIRKGEVRVNMPQVVSGT